MTHRTIAPATIDAAERLLAEGRSIAEVARQTGLSAYVVGVVALDRQRWPGRWPRVLPGRSAKRGTREQPHT